MGRELNFTLFLAHRWKNDLMYRADTCIKGQWFVEPEDVTYELISAESVGDYFMRLIEISRLDKKAEWWVPAIKYENKIYYHPTVKSICVVKKHAY